MGHSTSFECPKPVRKQSSCCSELCFLIILFKIRRVLCHQRSVLKEGSDAFSSNQVPRPDVRQAAVLSRRGGRLFHHNSRPFYLFNVFHLRKHLLIPHTGLGCVPPPRRPRTHLRIKEPRQNNFQIHRETQSLQQTWKSTRWMYFDNLVNSTFSNLQKCFLPLGILTKITN